MSKLVLPTAIVAVLLLVLGVAVTTTDAFVLKPWSLHHVASAKPGKRLWRPSRALSFGPELAAIRLSTSEYNCAENDSCEFATAWTADDGKSWQVKHEYTDFCGTSGILKDGVLRCLHSELKDDGKDDVITYKQHAYTIAAGGLLSSAEMSRTEVGDEHATFTSPPTEEAPPKGIRQFGDHVAFFPEQGLYLRNAALVLANDTEVHALYKSEDGQHWTFVSFVPIPFGQESAVMRWGETKVYIIAGAPGNYTQVESVYMGLRWEKVAPSKFSNLMNTYTSPYYTSLYTGLKGLPGLFAAAQGSKKGSEKPINIADFHNRLVKRKEEGVAPEHATNFSKEFLAASANMNETDKEFSCHKEPHSTEAEDGCESSSDATIVSTQNGTVFLFYDKLHAGFGPSTEERGSEVYALKMHLNETKEAKEHEERIEAAKRKAESDRLLEEQRRKAEKEAAERRKRERREKRRKDKERRATYAALDQVNIDRAVKEQELDDELVVVRNVDQTWLDLEKDTY